MTVILLVLGALVFIYILKEGRKEAYRRANPPSRRLSVMFEDVVMPLIQGLSTNTIENDSQCCKVKVQQLKYEEDWEFRINRTEEKLEILYKNKVYGITRRYSYTINTCLVKPDSVVNFIKDDVESEITKRFYGL